MTTAAKWQIIRNVIINKSAPNNRQNIGAMERVVYNIGRWSKSFVNSGGST
jgi:hypothetical protein